MHDQVEAAKKTQYKGKRGSYSNKREGDTSVKALKADIKRLKKQLNEKFLGVTSYYCIKVRCYFTFLFSTPVKTRNKLARDSQNPRERAYTNLTSDYLQ